MGFDDRAALDGTGFNDVRINRALSEELNALELLGFVGEAVNKLAADELALSFRIGNTRQLVHEALGVHPR